MTDKLDKRAVNYRDGSGLFRCGTCTMFRAPHGCTKVEGFIESDDVCDVWYLRPRYVPGALTLAPVDS